ncbi:hypothetical protein D3C73_1647770 [compost metagenome]
MGNARHAREALGHLAQNLFVLDVSDHFEVVPDTVNRERRIEVLEHGTDVAAQLTDEALANRPALDGDLWEDFYD